MNFSKLRQTPPQRVQIQPPAKFIDPVSGREKIFDDDWAVADVQPDRLRLDNHRTGHQVVLGPDHVHHYTSNPGRSTPGATYGFLTLNVQIFVRGVDVQVRPTRPGEPLRATPEEPNGLRRAVALVSRQKFEDETRELLQKDARAFTQAALELFNAVMLAARDVSEHAGLDSVFGQQDHHQVVVFMDSVSMQLLVRKLAVNSAAGAHYLLRFFRGRLLTPEEIAKGLMTIEDPQELSRDEILPTRLSNGAWAWKYNQEILTASDLAGLLMEKLVRLRGSQAVF